MLAYNRIPGQQSTRAGTVGNIRSHEEQPEYKWWMTRVRLGLNSCDVSVQKTSRFRQKSIRTGRERQKGMQS